MTELGGLSLALSALQAQSRALQTAGNNIANASTVGYSRQRADLASVSGPTIPSMWSTTRSAGQGVTVQGVSRAADQLLQDRVVAAHGQSAFLTGQADVLSGVEDAFGEPSDTGLTETLSTLWGGFGDVADHPSELGARSTLLQQAGAAADQLRQVSGQLQTQWETQKTALAASVDDITRSAAGIATLNGQIQAAQAAGEPTGDLADKRDTLVQHLGELCGVTTRAHDDGTMDVLLGGSTLVTGTTARGLSLTGSPTYPTAGAGSLGVTWSDTGTAAAVPGGGLGAALEAVNTTLPAWRDRVDAVAASLASTVNAGQAAGYDLAGRAGQPIFSGTTAATITVVMTDPRGVAASGSATATYDGSNALDLADLASSTTGADAAWRSAVGDLGVAAHAATRSSDVQTAVTAQADAAKESVSGVDIDEEMTSMLQFQHAYEAASKYMNTLNETMDSLMAVIR